MIEPKDFFKHKKERLQDLIRRGVSAKHLVGMERDYEALQKLQFTQEQLLSQRRQAAQKRDHALGKTIKIKLDPLEIQLHKKQKAFEAAWNLIPNYLDPEVPDGKDETDNVEVRLVGERPEFSFAPRSHIELGELNHILDLERAAKVSGSRYSYLKNQAVRLEFALIQMAFDLLEKEGFQPILPPVIIPQSVAAKTGYPEAISDDAFALKLDNLFLVGTSEQSILPYYMDEILPAKLLPARFVGFSTAFRREAGSYGKDVKGIIRQHHFDKVEMVSFTSPKHSANEHAFLLSMEEKIMQELELPYRVLLMCTAELAPPQYKKYDVEVWLPSQKRYLETHSTSNCTDYQARNFNIRYRGGEGKTDYAHTLNATAIAIGRTLVALLENHQRPDGSIVIPRALTKYCGFDIIKSHEGTR